MILAFLAGLAVRRLPGLLLPHEYEDKGQEGYILSAVLGLLALLLGFTFSLALDRYEDRRKLVIAEANSIGTAYLRTQLLPEPARGEISLLLAGYLDNRIMLAGPRTAEFPELLKNNDEALVQVWRKTIVAFDDIRTTPLSAAYINSVNEMIDLDTARKQARNAKIPSVVYASLFIYLVVASVVLGYVLIGFWARVSAVFLFALLVLSLLLVVDIDRPLTGYLQEEQNAMVDLAQFIKKNPPQSFIEAAGS